MLNALAYKASHTKKASLLFHYILYKVGITSGNNFAGKFEILSAQSWPYKRIHPITRNSKGGPVQLDISSRPVETVQ